MSLPQDIDLEGTAVSTTQVLLKWTDSANTANLYQVVSNGDTLDTVVPPLTSYTDNSVVAGAVFDYQIFGISTVGNGFSQIYESNIESLSTPESDAAGQVTLTWAQGTPGSLPLIGYRIARSYFEDGPFTNIASVDAKTLTYVDTDVTQGVSYFYDIIAVAVNFYSESDPSNVLEADVPEPTPPTAPVLVSVTIS